MVKSVERAAGWTGWRGIDGVCTPRKIIGMEVTQSFGHAKKFVEITTLRIMDEFERAARQVGSNDKHQDEADRLVTARDIPTS